MMTDKQGAMPRLAGRDEDLVGKVCLCSLFLPGLVLEFGRVEYPDGNSAQAWLGSRLKRIARTRQFERLPWSTRPASRTKNVVVVAESFEEYVAGLR